MCQFVIMLKLLISSLKFHLEADEERERKSDEEETPGDPEQDATTHPHPSPRPGAVIRGVVVLHLHGTLLLPSTYNTHIGVPLHITMLVCL